MSAADDFERATEALLREMRADVLLTGTLTVYRMPGGNLRVHLKWDGGELTRELSPEVVDQVHALMEGNR